MPGLREIFSGNGTHRKRDAAIGAAAGSFLGPIGTIAGGALGGWFGGRSDNNVPTINSGNTLPPPSLNLPSTSLPQMSTSTPPVTFGGNANAPVDTSSLGFHPAAPSLPPPTVAPPPGVKVDAAPEPKKPADPWYWNNVGMDTFGTSNANPFWGGQGGGGNPMSMYAGLESTPFFTQPSFLPATANKGTK